MFIMKLVQKLFFGLAVTSLTFATAWSQTEGKVIQPQSTTQKKKDVSDEELKQFVSIYKKVQEKNKEAQQEMAKAVQDEGITIQRYQEIAQASKNPNKEVEITKEEKTKMKAIKASFTEIQNSFKTKITGVIEDGGMSPSRYQQVFQQIKMSKELQAEFGELMEA